MERSKREGGGKLLGGGGGKRIVVEGSLEVGGGKGKRRVVERWIERGKEGEKSKGREGGQGNREVERTKKVREDT